MARPQLELTREQILAFRRRVGALEERLPPGSRSLRKAAWAGLQDSMPRAALLSLHARVEDVQPASWEDEALVQVWGPRFSTYVVPAQDHALFTLGRHPDDERARRRAEDLAARLAAFLEGRRLPDHAAQRGLGVGNGLRRASTTGTVLIRWEGARAPTVWTVPPPAAAPLEARRELARRYLHVFGPTTAASFAVWAGIGAKAAAATFESLAASLLAVRTPIGVAWSLARDERELRAAPDPAPVARLLPSGDAYFLLQGADRELLVPEPRHRGELWTSRVWPGAVLLRGELVGTWRRANVDLSIAPWQRLSATERRLVEAEAQSLPLPGLDRQLSVRWDG